MSAQGVRMLSDFWFRFTTAAITPHPPTVTMLPADGATGVPLTAVLLFSFTEPMDHTPTEAAVSTFPQVALQFSWSADSKNLTAVPAGGLQPGTTYTVTVLPSARSQAGATMLQRFTSTFTTGTGAFGPLDPGLLSALTIAGWVIIGVVLLLVLLLILRSHRRRKAETAALPTVSPLPAAPEVPAPYSPPAPAPPPSQPSTQPVPPPGPPQYPPSGQYGPQNPAPPPAPPATPMPGRGGPPPPPPSAYDGAATELPKGSITGRPSPPPPPPPPGRPGAFVPQPPAFLSETPPGQSAPLDQKDKK